MSRPTIAEVSALIADLAALRRNRTSAEYAALMDRKAELLERIAVHTPGDADAPRWPASPVSVPTPSSPPTDRTEGNPS